MMDILVVYISESGNTKQMAGLIEQGALQEGGVSVSVKAADEILPEDAEQAHAIVIGTPARYGKAYWPVYKFFDDVGKNVNLSGKIGSVFASGGFFGGGVEMAMLSLIAAMMSKGMLVYSGGTSNGKLHIGAASQKTPTGQASDECLSLGKNIAVLVKKMQGLKA